MPVLFYIWSMYLIKQMGNVLKMTTELSTMLFISSVVVALLPGRLTAQVSSPGYDTLTVADPTIFMSTENTEATYYLYGTSGDRSVNAGFRAYRSKDLLHWQSVKGAEGESALVLDSSHNFGQRGFWAPQVFTRAADSVLMMAYTANEQIALASTNEGPAGVFQQKKRQPLFHDGFKHIDPFIFYDTLSGKTFIYFVKLDQGNKIFVATLSADHKEPSGFKVVPGSEKLCIEASTAWENTADADWPVTEGPTVLRHNGFYYLLYSANDFRNPDYAVGYATSSHPAGPWVKASQNPIISTKNTGLNGSGHGDVLKDPRGNFFYVFHAHYSKQKVAPRKTYMVPFLFVPAKKGPDKILIDKSRLTPLLLKK